MSGSLSNKPRLLALASGGGHWVQLMRLRPAFDAFDTSYVSMFDHYAGIVGDAPYYTVPDASRFELRSFVPVFVRAFGIMLRERPSVIVTTGSAPMLAFIVLGRLFGARTLWIDSIANSERLSSSGRLAKKLADIIVSQWPEVAAHEEIEYWGRVI